MPNYKVGIEVETDTNDSAKKLSGVGSAAEGLGDAFGKGLGDIDAFGIGLGDLLNPTTLITAGVAALGTAIIATAASAMDLAAQVDTSTALMTTQLGLTNEQAGAFEGTMRSIYENNYGESFEDIAASMTAVEQNFRRIGGTESQEQLQQVTQMALAFGDAFDADVNESTSAAVTLMDNFGLTATQAFDFLTAAEQRGLNASGDLLDSIGEYSVQFSQSGASASEFFSILESGNQGGVLGTDKVADAVKEFGIRIVDNSTTTKTALESIGINYDKLTQGFADGSITQIGAMQQVISKINEIEDPIQRNTVGVALFGTQWEDLSETVLTQIDTQKTALGDLEGAAASLEEQYAHTGSEAGNAMREWNNALVDVGDALNELRDAILPGVTWFMENVLMGILINVGAELDKIRLGIELIKGIGDWVGDVIPGGDPPVEKSSVPLAGTSSMPLSFGGPMAALAGAGGQQIIQQFYIDRGDPDVVQSAAELGIVNAQRVRGG